MTSTLVENCAQDAGGYKTDEQDKQKDFGRWASGAWLAAGALQEIFFGESLLLEITRCGLVGTRHGRSPL